MKRARPVSILRPGAASLRPLLMSLPFALASAPLCAETGHGEVSLRFAETISDNLALRSGSAAQGGTITEISPSVTYTANTGRVVGDLAASVSALQYSGARSGSRITPQLRANARIEAIDQRAFIDVRGLVSQQNASAFGPRNGSPQTSATNTSEVRNFSLSPYVVGRIGNSGTTELRYRITDIQSTGPGFIGSRQQSVSGFASDPSAWGNLGWSANARDETTDYSSERRRDIKQQNVRLTGHARVDGTLGLRLIVGREANNISSAATRRSTITGAGADWSPTTRTSVSATWEDRFFGPGYMFRADHRMSRFTLTGSLTKNATSSSQNLLTYREWDSYDLMAPLFENDPRFVQQFPDPVAREQAIRDIIRNTLHLGDQVLLLDSALSSSFFVDKRLQLGLAYRGPRDTWLLTGYRSNRDRLTEVGFELGGDLATNQKIIDTGIQASVTHPFTPLTSGTLRVTRNTVSNEGTGTTPGATHVSTRFRRIETTLSTQFSEALRGTLLLRFNSAEGSLNYDENAVVASLFARF